MKKTNESKKQNLNEIELDSKFKIKLDIKSIEESIAKTTSSINFPLSKISIDFFNKPITEGITLKELLKETENVNKFESKVPSSILMNFTGVKNTWNYTPPDFKDKTAVNKQTLSNARSYFNNETETKNKTNKKLYQDHVIYRANTIQEGIIIEGKNKGSYFSKLPEPVLENIFRFFNNENKHNLQAMDNSPEIKSLEDSSNQII